jgi:hypothetical protein
LILFIFAFAQGQELDIAVGLEPGVQIEGRRIDEIYLARPAVK